MVHIYPSIGMSQTKPVLASMLLEMFDDNSLIQVVDKPPRGKNILDFMLADCPPLFNKVDVMPPLRADRT